MLALSNVGLSVLSVVPASITGMTPAGLLASIPGVICGHLALVRFRRSGGAVRGRMLAIVGLTVGYITTAFWTGIACWNPRQRDHIARETSCRAHLNHIGLTCRLYASDHGGVFPVSLAALYPEYLAPLMLFVCSLTLESPGAAESIGEWTDYVLIPGRSKSDDPDTVLA